MSEPLVSIVIPAFNKWEYTFKCLMALLQHTHGVAYETIVIDNASSDDTAQGLPMLEGIRVHRNEQNLGFAKACNQGAAMAKGKYVLFLNNDTEAQPNWLPPMVQFAEADPSIAIVGSKLLFPDGTLQHAGVGFIYGAPFPISPVHLHYRKPPEASTVPLELNCVTAACMLVRADVFKALGGFDEAYVNGYEDVDLCLKAREAGHRIVYTPDSVLVHHESVSDGRHRHNDANIQLLHRRWLGKFEAFDLDQRTDRWVNDPAPGRPPLSVVVPMHDALRWAVPCLERVIDNLGPNDELVVVDNGSTDATPLFLKLFAQEHPKTVKVVTLSAHGAESDAMAAGLNAAREAVGVVMSQHLRMPQGCLDQLWSKLQTGATDAVTFRSHHTHLAMLAARQWLERSFGQNDRQELKGARLAVVEDEAVTPMATQEARP